MGILRPAKEAEKRPIFNITHRLLGITVGLGALANLFLGVYEAIDEDSKVPDLLIVVGSSLEVRPVAKIPYDIPQNIRQILINRDSHHHLNFDIELLRR